MKFVNSQICLKLFSYTVDILLHNNVFFIQLAKSLCWKNSAFGVLLEAEALQHSYDIVSTS